MTNINKKKVISTAFLTTILVFSVVSSAILLSPPKPVSAILPSSFTFTTFPAAGGPGSHGVAVDTSGIVWWVPVGPTLVRQDPTLGPGLGVTIFPLNHGAVNVAVDPSGADPNVWISDSDGFVTKFTPGPNTITDISTGTSCFLDHIHFHNDGKVYTTGFCPGQNVFQIDPVGLGVTTYTVPSASSLVAGITGSFDGKIWMIERDLDNVVRFDTTLAVPTTSTGMTEFAIPTPSSQPETIRACLDDIWFTQLGSGPNGPQIGVIDRTTNAITEFDVDPGFVGGTYGLAVDGNGNPWVASGSTSKVYAIDRATNTPAAFSTPNTPHHIAISPSGELWYTNFAAEVVRMTPDVALKPTCIPVAPPGLGLTPPTATNPVGTSHTVTVTVTQNGTPVAGVIVTFTVTGANSATGTCTTGPTGQCSFTYPGTNPGTDMITATATVNGAILKGEATKIWEEVPIVEGRMTGGGSVFTTAGVRVTHGFELHCDTTKAPNNLEINWGKGNNFHLTSLTSATCTDDTSITPNPPPAGFDTYHGIGTGTLNGAPATIDFTFTDAGEPGKSDKATISINGGAALSVSGTLKVGNHQAHKQ